MTDGSFPAPPGQSASQLGQEPLYAFGCMIIIVRDDLEPLKHTLEEVGVTWPKGRVTAGFEHDNRDVFNEDSGQPTSIDLAVSGDGRSLFIESKLVEKEFGGCSVFARGDCNGENPLRCGLDQCYLHHIGRKYWERLQEFGFTDDPLVSGPVCPFTCYYQFYREVLFALAEEGTFILLCDERSPVFVRTSGGHRAGLWPLLKSTVPTQYADRLACITIQQVTSQIRRSGRHSDWIEEFYAKYGLTC